MRLQRSMSIGIERSNYRLADLHKNYRVYFTHGNCYKFKLPQPYFQMSFEQL